MKFLEAVANVFRIPDLRKRLLFALASAGGVPPGRAHPDSRASTRIVWRSSSARTRARCSASSICSAAGRFSRLTIFALGIMPYITSSIILQLLTVVVPTLEKLQKEGELGRRKITQWTRYLTVILALIQSLRYRHGAARRAAGLRDESRLRLHPDDHAEPDHRHGVHHVAGRADYRARHRQRHVADHLHRHRGESAGRDLRDGQQGSDRRLAADPGGHHSGHDGRRWSASSYWWNAASAASRCNTPSA